MKCILCNERNASTRCEGCQQLYCLPCMNKHHDELAQQFQLLTNVRNELKQSLDVAESTSKNNNRVPCIVEIDRWEQEMIQRIRKIATKTRTSVNEIMAKNVIEVRRRLDQLSDDIQQRQKEGNYLENDIDTINSQLNQLKNDIEHVNEKIQIDSTTLDNLQWNTLICIVDEDLSSNLNLVDFKQKKVRIRPCIVCKRYFEDLLPTGLCSDCDYNREYPPSHYGSISRFSPTNIESSLDKNAGFVIPVSSSPMISNPQKVACPLCKHLNMISGLRTGMDFTCAMCEYVFRPAR